VLYSCTHMVTVGVKGSNQWQRRPTRQCGWECWRCGLWSSNDVLWSRFTSQWMRQSISKREGPVTLGHVPTTSS